MDQFSEYLKIFSTLTTNNEKSDFVSSIVPANIVPQVLLALETKDYNAFKLSINQEDPIDPTISSINSEPPVEVAPVSPEGLASALPEEAVVDNNNPAGVTGITNTTSTEAAPDTDINPLAPTIESVSGMTDEVKGLSDEQVDTMPESVKSGVQIWKDASEDFTKKIIARTVYKLHNGEFSEIEEPSEKDVLEKGAESAVELVNEGEHRTSLDKAVDDINSELESSDVANLIRIYGELKQIEDSAKVFIEYVSDKNDLGLSPATKDEVISEVLDNGLFNLDGSISRSLLTSLNKSSDYSHREVEDRMKIATDFSEVDCIADDGDISDDTITLLNRSGSFDDALSAVESALADKGVTEENAEEMITSGSDDGDYSESTNNLDNANTLSDDILKIKDNYHSEAVKEMIGPTSINNAMPTRSIGQGAYMTLLDKKLKNDSRSGLNPVKHMNNLIHKNTYEKLTDPITVASYTVPTIGSIAASKLGGSLELGEKENSALTKLGGDLGDIALMSTMSGKKAPTRALNDNIKSTWNKLTHSDHSEGDESINESEDMSVKSAASKVVNTVTKAVKDNAPKVMDKVKDPAVLAAGGAALAGGVAASKINALKSNEEDSLGTKALKGVGRVAVPVVAAAGAYAGSKGISKSVDNYKIHKAQKSMGMSQGDASEGEVSEEVMEDTTNNVAEQSLGNNDMIKALAEKYKMLPTVETKNFMIEDLRAKGFDESIINTLLSMSSGEFSEDGEGAQVDPSQVDPQSAIAQGAPVESVIATDIFDDLVGPAVGATDYDGTLAPGVVSENGAEGTDILGGLSTDGDAYPIADPTGQSRVQEVAQAIASTQPVENQMNAQSSVGDEGDSFESIL